MKEHYFYPILAYHAEQRNMSGELAPPDTASPHSGTYISINPLLPRTEALRCVEVMKGLGLRLRKISFQYLLKAVREESGASSEGGVASSDDISRLLEHIEVFSLLGACLVDHTVRNDEGTLPSGDAPVVKPG